MTTPVGVTWGTRRPNGRIASFTETDRDNLAGSDKHKVQQAATYPRDPKFSTIEELTKQQNHGREFLSTNLDFLQLIQKLRSRMSQYFMTNVFMIYTFDATTNRPDATPPVDLLTDFATVTLDQVKENSTMYFEYGNQVMGENLQWSKQLLLSSCEDSLRNKIESQMATLPSKHDTGPVAFFLIASIIVSTSQKIARALTSKLQFTRLYHFPGEDVEQMAATVRAAATRLRTANLLPGDMNEIVLEIIDSSTIFAFRSTFHTLKTMSSPIVADWEQLLDKACVEYRELILRDKWHPTVKKKSGFQAEKEGKKSSRSNANQTAVTASNSTAPSNQGPKTHDRSGRPIDRTPPSSGASKTRSNNGRTEHWCPKCDNGTGRWGNHLEQEHDQFVANQRERYRQRRANRDNGNNQNNAPSNQAPTLSTASTASGSARRTQFAPSANAPAPSPGAARVARPNSILRVPTYNPFGGHHSIG